MKRLLPFLLLLLSPLAYGATITAASCSQSDVQTAVTSAATGDTVSVPTGSCSWSSAVVVPNTKGIILQGGNGGTTTIAQGSSSGYIQLNQNASTGSRVTAFTFTGAGSSSNCDVAVIGSPSSAPARIDNNIFTNASGSEFICTSGNAQVLIDHNAMTGGAASEMIHNLGLGASDASGWTNDVTPGGSGMVFIEDNTFTFAAVTAFFGTSAVQSYYGARTVFRHNTLNNAQVDQHGTPGNIGARWWEVYNNVFCTYPGINQSNYGDLRAGSGVFYNNTVPTSAPCGNNTGGGFVTLHEEDSGYPALYQIGRGISQNLSPAYLWNNAAGITVNSGSANVQANRDYFVSGSQPSSLVRWELSTDNGSTTYSYTPYIYPHPLQNVATTYFVSNAGSDAAAGTSSGASWKTIAKVNGFSFSSGDVIQFARGDTWNEQTDAALTPASNTTVTSYGAGALPILDGHSAIANGVNATSKSGVVIDSLQLQNYTSYAVLFSACSTCSVTNSTLSNAATHGINVTGASPTCTLSGNTYSTSAAFDMSGKVFNVATTSGTCTMNGNTIDLSNVLNTRNVSGIVCSASTTGCIATNNVITMAQGVQGIGIKSVSASGHTTGGQITGNSITGLTNACGVTCDGEAIELTGDATHQVTNTLVGGNYVKNGSASADCIGLFWATGNTVSYNFCIGNAGQNAAIHLTTGSNNNFLYGNDTYGSNYGFEIIAVTGNDIQNNICAGHQRGIGFFTGATGTYDYNDCYNSSIANFVSGTDGGHNKTSDPKFVTSPPTAANDFKLQVGSPAINAGVNLGATYQMTNSSTDTVFPYLPANQNSFGAGWEMGAFQYVDVPAAQISAFSLAFSPPSQVVSTSSSTQSLTLTNIGNVNLAIASIAITGANADQFSQTNDCAATLGFGLFCTITVTFSPTSIGGKTASIFITDDSGGVAGSTQTAALTGTGIAAVPIVISPSAPALRASATQSFTATQNGSPVSGGVTWSCPGCAGSVNSSTGVYTAPSSITATSSLGGCQVTPNDSVWNTRVDSLPLDANSATYMAQPFVHTGHLYLAVNNGYGSPYGNYDDGTFPSRSMTFTYDSGSNGSYKIPPLPDAEAENGWYGSGSVDRHILTTNPSTCEFQELYKINANPAANPNAQSGTKYNGDSYAFPALSGGSGGGAGTSAAGTPLFPLDLHFEELENAVASGGALTHALRLTLPNNSIAKTWVWPAQTYTPSAFGAMPYGSRLRLKSSFNWGAITSPASCTVASGCQAIVTTLVTALKQYGIVLTDGGLANTWQVIVGQANWPKVYQDAFLAFFNKSIIGSAQLEVVDESSLMVSQSTSETTTGERVVATQTSVPSNNTSMAVVLRGVTINTSKDVVNIQAGMTAYQLPAPYIGGTATTTATYTMTPTVGTLTSGGLYTPPATVVNRTTTMVTITSVADTSVKTRMTINVLPTGTIRILPGRSANYTDTLSNVWQQGQDMGNGLALILPPQTYPTTPDIFIYKAVGAGTGKNGDIRFDFVVANGNYNVKLKLAAWGSTCTAAAPAQRAWNLETQGNVVFPNIDPAALAGACFTPADYVLPAIVTDNKLHFTMRSTNNASPSVAGIEIASSAAPPPPPADQVVAFSPTSLTFSGMTVGVLSGPQDITLTNTGSTGTLTISVAPHLTGTDAAQFGLTTTCGGTVAPAGTCTISVSLTPTGAAGQSAAVSLTDDSGNSPGTVQTLPLSGSWPIGVMKTQGTSIKGLIRP